MLQHHQEPEPISSQSLPIKPDFSSTQIETYLDRISPSVEETLTEEARQERRAEMKTHLGSLIAAYIELGDTPEQALAKALQQFGDSRSVQKEWKRANTSDLRQSLGIVCALYGITFVLYVLMINSNTFNHGLAFGLLFLGLLTVPAGFGTGFLARRHPIRSAFKAQTFFHISALCLNVYWMLWPKAATLLQDRGIRPSFASLWGVFFEGQYLLLPALGILLCTAVFGVLAGSFASGFGGWLRKQNQRLRQHIAR